MSYILKVAHINKLVSFMPAIILRGPTQRIHYVPVCPLGPVKIICYAMVHLPLIGALEKGSDMVAGEVQSCTAFWLASRSLIGKRSSRDMVRSSATSLPIGLSEGECGISRGMRYYKGLRCSGLPLQRKSIDCL